MDKRYQEKPEMAGTPFSRKIGVKELRKLRARRDKQKSVWFGLGMFGLIGWSVIIPALLGVALGLWIDQHYPSRYSWTLMLLVMGLLLGCLSAWGWVAKEQREIRRMHGEERTNRHDHQ